jgi:hypothetical protein
MGLTYHILYNALVLDTLQETHGGLAASFNKTNCRAWRTKVFSLGRDCQYRYLHPPLDHARKQVEHHLEA